MPSMHIMGTQEPHGYGLVPLLSASGRGQLENNHTKATVPRQETLTENSFGRGPLCRRPLASWVTHVPGDTCFTLS